MAKSAVGTTGAVKGKRGRPAGSATRAAKSSHGGTTAKGRSRGRPPKAAKTSGSRGKNAKNVERDSDVDESEIIYDDRKSSREESPAEEEGILLN